MYHYNGAQWYEQFLQVSQSTGSGFDCVCFSCLLGASVSSVFMMLDIFFVTLLPFIELSLVGLALDLID